jgi:hypothetical protein
MRPTKEQHRCCECGKYIPLIDILEKKARRFLAKDIYGFRTRCFYFCAECNQKRRKDAKDNLY